MNPKLRCYAAFSSSITRLHDLFIEADSVLAKADAPLVHLSQRQLNQLCDDVSSAVLCNTILPLSTLQQGYFSMKLSNSDSTYVQQITLPFNNVDLPKMIEA